MTEDARGWRTAAAHPLRWLPRRSLRARLLLWFMGLVVLAIILVGLAISLRAIRILQDRYFAAYQSNAQAVVALVDDELQHGVQGNRLTIKHDELNNLVDALAQNFNVQVRLYRLQDNTLIATSSITTTVPAGDHLAPDTFAPLTYVAWVVPSPLSVRVAVARVQVARPLTDRAYQQRQFLLAVAWITLGALLLLLIVGSLLANRLTAPLRLLTRTTSLMSAGSLGMRVPENRDDEAGELARQFNRMAERLEESFRVLAAERDRLTLDRDHLRQFVADVSHELRTPLTALNTFNDLLQAGAGDDPATRREFLSESAQQIERLNWLTRNLLDLSRLEAGLTRIDRRDADLADTVRRAVASSRPLAAEKGVMLRLDNMPLTVAHDPPRLEQAITNIVHNAVKFSPAGRTVDVRLQANGAQATIDVRDQGAGIPPDEVEHVFQRFYRGRDATRGGEGSGLGLAIAKAIVDAHGGSIVVESVIGQGTTMRLALPVSMADASHAEQANKTPTATAL